MEFADQGGLNQATSWVSGNGGATQTEAPPAAPAPQQQQQTQQQGAPAGDPNPVAPPAAPEDLTPYRELVDGLGGMEGVRQFDPLYKAVTSTSQDWGEIGQGINKALKELLGGDQYGALAMALHGEYGELLAEEFIAQNPEWLQSQIAKASGGQRQQQQQADDDFGELDASTAQGQQQQQQMTPREKELTDRLAQVEGRLNEMTRSSEETSEQRLRAHVEKQVFGTIVDQTFGQLEGWDEAEMQQVVRMAMSEFSFDKNAKDAFAGADKYLRTKQPLLASQLVKAQNAFKTHMKNAMELVDLKRQSARKAAAPVEPERKEFGTNAPAQPDTRQQPTNREQNAQFWDANDLQAAVRRNLQARGVPTA